MTCIKMHEHDDDVLVMGTGNQSMATPSNARGQRRVQAHSSGGAAQGGPPLTVQRAPGVKVRDPQRHLQPDLPYALLGQGVPRLPLQHALQALDAVAQQGSERNGR